MPLDAPANTLNLIDLRDIRDNTLILKGGALVQVLMVSGTNFALKPEDEQNIITASYQRFLNSLGFSVQIIIHSRKVNVEKYLEVLKKREQEEPSPLLQNQIFEYQEFIKSFVKDNPIMSKSFFVAVPYHPGNLKLPAQSTAGKKTGGAQSKGIFGFFSRSKKGPEVKKPPEEETAENKQEMDKSEEKFQEELEKDRQQLKQRVLHVINGLETIGLQAKILSDEELVELFYNFYNPETTERKDLTLPQQNDPL